MISLDNITQIEFGITSYCNAGCPLCARHNYGTSKLSDNIELKNLSYEKFVSISEQLLNHTTHISADFCGTVGDIIAHPDAERIIIFAAKKYKEVNIHTNGSAKNYEFWHNIGKHKNINVTFSIDGLDDTNHLYRINTDYDKIISNAKVFIKAGGFATWKFIKFKHNEHQVKEAEILANSLGFKKFESIASTRWVLPDVKVLPTAYKNKINKSKNIVNLAPATTADKTKINQYQKQTYALQEINCRTVADGYLYIDEVGKLWPCCYFHSHYVAKRSNFLEWWKNIEKLYGKNFNDLQTNNFKNLLEHDFFVNYLPKSFTSKENVCYRCLQSCSKGVEQQRINDFFHKKLVYND